MCETLSNIRMGLFGPTRTGVFSRFFDGLCYAIPHAPSKPLSSPRADRSSCKRDAQSRSGGNHHPCPSRALCNAGCGRPCRSPLAFSARLRLRRHGRGPRGRQCPPRCRRRDWSVPIITAIGCASRRKPDKKRFICSCVIVWEVTRFLKSRYCCLFGRSP